MFFNVEKFAPNYWKTVEGGKGGLPQPRILRDPAEACPNASIVKIKNWNGNRKGRVYFFFIWYDFALKSSLCQM